MADEIVIPVTGELVPLLEPARVALALHEIRQIKQDLDIARRELENALLEESRRQGTKTLRFDGVEATISGGDRLAWDLDELAQLEQLGLPADRMNALVKTTITYKVDANVAKQIEGSGNEDYARVIQNARSREPAPWRVDVVTRNG